jgi:acid stress chaperone HdeB
MRVLFGAACIAAIAVAAPAAHSDSLDLSTVKCEDFLKSGKDNIAIIITWLDGYYKEKDDPPVMDFDKFGKNSGKLGEYCGANPSVGLITAADKILGK